MEFVGMCCSRRLNAPGSDDRRSGLLQLYRREQYMQIK
jgi:hypothetical protein